MADKHKPQPSVAIDPYLPAGYEALRAGDLKKAAEICAASIAAQPNVARGHFLAALIALASKDRVTALNALEATVKLNQKHSAAWARLAELYITTGRVRRAETCLNNAVNTDRGNGRTRDLIGKVLRLAGNLDASLLWHQKAVDADENHVPFLINLANAHLFKGDRKTARQILLNCIAKDPPNAQAHWLLSRAATATSRSHIDEMNLLINDELPAQSVAYLQYAIGKEREDLEDWGGAFEAWTVGAGARRERVDFDESREIELFASLEATFTTAWFEQQNSECNNAGPVFIVGEPRTGTTLLDRMLDAHPAVTSAGELRHFGYAIRQVTGSDEPKQYSSDLMSAAAAADVTAIGEAYVNITAELRLDSAHIIDKLPSNYLYLPLILAALPNARVIHVRRDPMDTCLAIYKQLFADAYLYSYDLEELARHYKRYQHLMSVWRDRFGDRFVEIDYENLVSHPEEQLRSILKFTSLSWNPACLDYMNKDSAVTTASAHQVREAPHQRSVGRWRHFETQLQPVADILSG